MPFKHQAESYRTIDNARFECWGDFPHEEAVSERKKLKAEGWRIRLFRMDDGMTRLFRTKTLTARQQQTQRLLNRG